MKILVTGSSGFLGSYLVPHLRNNHEVLEWDKQEGFDIFDNKIEEAIKGSDVVVHLAALTNVRDSFDNESETFKVNTLGTCLLATYCAKHDKKMVFISTIATTQPKSSPYALSKHVAEVVLEQFEFVTILRFSNLFGLNMNNRSGALIYNLIESMKDNKPFLLMGDGSQSRDFIHAKDASDIIKTAVEDDWSGKKVDCVTGKNYTIKQIVEWFEVLGGVKVEYKEAAKGPQGLFGDPTLLKSLYKKELVTNVQEDIKEIIYHNKP